MRLTRISDRIWPVLNLVQVTSLERHLSALWRYASSAALLTRLHPRGERLRQAQGAAAKGRPTDCRRPLDCHRSFRRSLHADQVPKLLRRCRIRRNMIEFCTNRGEGDAG